MKSWEKWPTGPGWWVAKVGDVQSAVEVLSLREDQMRLRDAHGNVAQIERLSQSYNPGTKYFKTPEDE